MNKILIATILILLVLIIIFFVIYKLKSDERTAITPSSASSNSVQLANPASVNCIKLGGKLEIKNTPEGQVGYCTLPDGRVCEEWALFRGECGK